MLFLDGKTILRSERSLFKTSSDGYVGRLKLLAKVIRESGGCLWDCVTDDETTVAGLGDLFREQVVSHLRTHAPQADKTDALCSRERELTENASGRPHIWYLLGSDNTEHGLIAVAVSRTAAPTSRYRDRITQRKAAKTLIIWGEFGLWTLDWTERCSNPQI